MRWEDKPVYLVSVGVEVCLSAATSANQGTPRTGRTVGIYFINIDPLLSIKIFLISVLSNVFVIISILYS